MSHGLLRHRARLLIAFAALVFVALSLASPFIFTTQFARFVLERNFPENDPAVAGATLAASGVLSAHDIILHDYASLSARPLITIGKLRAEFGWRDLLARRLRSVVLDDVVLYARSSPKSQ